MNKDILLEDQMMFLEVSYKEGDLYIGFKVWNCTFYHPENSVEFHDEAASNGWENHSDRTKALPYLEGDLKWDGCINYAYPGQEHCMLHECGISGFKRILTVFEEIYKQGKEIIPNNII